MLTRSLLILALASGFAFLASAQTAQQGFEDRSHSRQALADLTRQAHQDFDSGRYTQARERLRAALKMAPRNSALWTYLGLTEAQLNETASAIADFEKALSLAPGDARTLFNLGLLYRRKGDAVKATERYRQGLALEPDDAAANQNYALMLMEAGKFREAIAPLEKLRKLGNSELAVRVALIESYLKAGMKGEGEREIQAVLKAPGVTPEDQIKLAGVLLEDKQPDIAQEVLEQAVRSAPDSAEAHARLGALLLNKNQYEDAAREEGRAVQLAPESAEYSMLLAETLILWKHYPVALQFLAAVKERFGNLPEYRYKVGLSYYGMHRFPQAVTEFEALADQRHNLDRVQFFLGNSYANMGDLNKAESHFRRAIGLNSENASYYAALAQLLLKESDDKRDEATALLEKALALDPSDVASKQELALCYEKGSRYVQAQHLLEDVVRQQPDLLPAHVALARIYYRERKKVEGDRERKIVSRLEAEQQANQSEASGTSPPPNP